MRFQPALLAIAAALTACGGKDDPAADSAQIAPVGSFQPQADSALAAGGNTIDSLRQAGQSPASGLDSAAAAGARASAGDTGRPRRP